MPDSPPVVLSFAEPAYRVPWSVSRGHPGSVTLTNASDETLTGVHLFLIGDGTLVAGVRSLLAPGDSVRFAVTAADPARNTVACVRWFRPSGDEYVWRVAF